MKRLGQENIRDLVIFTLLVAIGVAGRWGQPDWEFTPIAAASIFAGCYFSRLFLAALVPVAILAISDLMLPAYNSVPVLVVKYAAMILPAVLGRFLIRDDVASLSQNRPGEGDSPIFPRRLGKIGTVPDGSGTGSKGSSLWRWGVCGIAPATIFFFTTNFAVWAFQSDYPKTALGLFECYVAGLPFYRSMMTGDVFYLAVLVGCAAIAGERTFAVGRIANRPR